MAPNDVRAVWNKVFKDLSWSCDSTNQSVGSVLAGPERDPLLVHIV